MKILQIVIPLTLGVAAFFIDPDYWLSVASEILLALSILAAAVLFRLGRGLPTLAVEELETDEISSLMTAFKRVSTRLAVLFGFTGIAIVIQILVVLALKTWELEWFRQLLVSVSVGLSTFAVVRAVALVRGDVDLVHLQADLVKKNVQLRRASEESIALSEADKERPFKSPPKYGGLASFM